MNDLANAHDTAKEEQKRTEHARATGQPCTAYPLRDCLCPSAFENLSDGLRNRGRGRKLVHIVDEEGYLGKDFRLH